MRFCPCFVLSSFLVSGLSSAVQREWNPEALRTPGKALSVRDAADSPNVPDSTKDFTTALSTSTTTSDDRNNLDQAPADEPQTLSANNQPPNNSPAGLPDVVPTLHAQSLGDEIGHDAAAAGAVGLGAIYSVLKGVFDNVNTSPSIPATNDQGTKPLDFKENQVEPQQQEGRREGTLKGGTDTSRGGPGDNSRGSGSDGEGMCSSPRFRGRNTAWCDEGDDTTARLTHLGTIAVIGHRCTLQGYFLSYVLNHLLPPPQPPTFSPSF